LAPLCEVPHTNAPQQGALIFLPGIGSRTGLVVDLAC
jgi:hypothetical protein